MKEENYIMVTNLAKVRIATHVMMDVMGGDKYGITEDERTQITSLLLQAQEKLFSLMKIDRA